MKKRFLCFLLSLLMLVSLVPLGAVPASAVSRSTSENAIKVLKQMETFRAKAYQSNGQWVIGYGTPAQEGDIITESTADKALRAELEALDKTVSQFSITVRRDFTQYQHDALVLFSYDCGTAWMTANGRLRQAINERDTGNEFLTSICLWAGGEEGANTTQLNRRLAEANMFLNGIYSATPPSYYSYVFLDGNGGNVGGTRLLGINTNLMATIEAVPTKEGSRFLGWYTGKEGGSYVTTLDSQVAGLTLYAHWQEEGAGEVNGTVIGTAASYTLPASKAASLTVHETPSVTSKVIKTLIQNSTMSVVAEYVDAANTKWVKLRSGGWVSLGNVETPVSNIRSVTVQVTASSLNIREKAGAYAYHKIVKRVDHGESLTILETTLEGGQLWGRCADGWVCLMYTNYEQMVMDSDVESGAAIGTGVVNCSTVLKVRSGAGTYNAQVGTIKDGTKVAIYEIKTVSGKDWGRINAGWICLDYVVMDGEIAPEDKEDTDTSTETVIADGTVIHAYVNYRTGAGTGHTYKGQLAYGAKIKIYEITTVKGKQWGRFSDGWLCLDYVEVIMRDSQEQNPEETPEEKPEEKPSESTGKYWTAVATAQLAVYDESGKKTDQVVTQGQTVRVYELGSRENETQLLAKISQGYVLAKYLTLYIASETSTLKAEANLYGRPGGVATGKTLAKGTSVTVDKMQLIDDQVFVYVTASRGWIDAELLSEFAGLPEGSQEETKPSEPEETEPTEPTQPEETEPTEPTQPEETEPTEPQPTEPEEDKPDTQLPEGAKTGTVTGADVVNIRSSAGVRLDNLVTTLKRGTKVTVYETISKDDAQWGRIDQGWISMKYVQLDVTDSNGNTTAPVATGFVHGNLNLNVRTGPGTHYEPVMTLAPGTEVRIYEQQLTRGVIWGRIDQGWVCMSYVTLMTTGGSTGDQGSTEGSVMGTIARCYYAVNVRSNPGTGNALVGKILVGSRVEIYEQRMYSNEMWGRVNQGWICMKYVLLDSELPPPGEFEGGTGGTTTPTEPLPTVPKDALYLGSVIGTKTLNVRASASTKAEKVGTLNKGDSIVIYETAITDYMAWGRCDAGWVSLVYIDLVSCTDGAEDARVVQALNAAIREGAGTHYNKIGSYPKATVIDVYETSGNWVRTNLGWVSENDLLA